MGMEVEEHTDRTTLRIRGPVRLGEVSTLLDHARSASARGLHVDLDLAAAEHLHAAAFQVLIALERELRERGQALRITRMSDAIATMLEFLGLGAWLPSREEKG